MPSLHELIDIQFGVRTRSADNRENTSMTTTSQLIIRNDSSRLAFIINNLGQQTVLVRNNSEPSATVGYLIGPNGGSMSMIFSEDFNKVGHDWFGITPSGVTTIYVEEVLVEPSA